MYMPVMNPYLRPAGRGTGKGNGVHCMRFKKINDTTIRCIISQEEMWEKGIEIDDFLVHRGKTEDFLRDIVQQARDELDMDGIGHAFSVQMSVMRTGEISLLIAEDSQGSMQQALESFKEQLLGFQEAMQKARERKKEDTYIEAAETSEEAAVETGAEEKKEEKEEELPFWVVLESMDGVIDLCRRLADRNVISSRLYKFQEAYYLRLQFAQGKKDITDAIMTLSEFCNFAFTEEQGGYALEEHGQVLLREHAVEQLGNL